MRSCMCRYLSIALGPLVESDKPRERAGLGGVKNMEGGWDAGQSESLSKATLAAFFQLSFFSNHFTSLLNIASFSTCQQSRSSALMVLCWIAPLTC